MNDGLRQAKVTYSKFAWVNELVKANERHVECLTSQVRLHMLATAYTELVFPILEQGTKYLDFAPRSRDVLLATTLETMLHEIDSLSLSFFRSSE